VDSAVSACISSALARDTDIQHRRLDAGHGGGMAHDLADPSPVLIALVQAAASLPMFFLALPAGALADIVQRRRILLVSNLWALAAVATLSYLTLVGRTSPWMLLTLTFAVGLGEALQGPAFQAVVTELVPRSGLATAVLLNSAGYNLARAIGPALGGFILAKAGAGINFLLNVVACFGVLVVLYRWREAPRRSVLPAERFVGAMRAGLRYVAYAPELRAVLVRTGGFILSGSALWALLPVLVRDSGRGPSGYGILLGALGVGALGGAAVLPLLKRRIHGQCSNNERFASAVRRWQVNCADLGKKPTTKEKR
jgi:MFS family permease